ncbi:hypothetical protein AU192_07255 [Mycobacterium lehmannii]|uniref:Uncharacterized protein n=1 Tax=Mycobacterium lehmannii TaxID=2048550 RepID=A0A117JJT1_9MYCO|nr:hypothetical protein [Mycobacterium lehmannii]KUI15651.1 hypothetical protein AU192_07255 [Mycobacterium lehmannii]
MTTINTDREVVEGAMALIAADGAWTQGTYCRDATGNQVMASVDRPGDWVRVCVDDLGQGGFSARTELGATPYSFCLQGALRTAAGYWMLRDSQAVHEQIERLETLLLELANSVAVPGWPALDAFNDDASTTKTDVVLLLKHAVALLEREEHR